MNKLNCLLGFGESYLKGRKDNSFFPEIISAKEYIFLDNSNIMPN